MKAAHIRQGVSLRRSNFISFLISLFQAYHSQIKDFSASVGNMAILPLRTQQRGPAPTTTAEQDIIDESLYYFKSNVFFRTYEIKVRPRGIPLIGQQFITHCTRFSRKWTGS